MKRCAFIDVHNTRSTATVLGFSIDPEKLYNYLKFDKWSCFDIFWYAGRIDNEKHDKEREKIEKIGYNIKDKFTKFYKKTRTFDIKCSKCGYKDKYVDVRKGLPKANCDVELTVDCLEIAGPEVEFLIFTGDGDFKYLVEKLVEKGSKVSLFSTKKQDKWGDYRFSTRYNDILKEDKITFMEIDNLKYRLKKDLENEVNIEEIDSL